MKSPLLQEDPLKLVALLKYASRFPDYPMNFTIPSLSDPNYVAPNNSLPLEVLCYVMASLSTITVVLRLWIRKRMKGMQWGWDDWLIIPGQILTLGTILVCLLLIKLAGSGMHIYDISYDMIAKTQLLEFIGVMLYFTAICVIRLSITAFLYRLIGLTSKIKRNLLHITVILLILQFLNQIFTFVFACKPISAGWDLDVRLAGYTCDNVPLEIFSLAIVYIIMDIWLLVLPVHTVWNLQLPLRTRIGVTWLFAFGAVACAGAVYKTVYVYSVFDSFDPTWKGRGFQMGAMIEIGFGVITSSMPALNHILITSLPNFIDSQFSSTLVSKWLGSGSSRSQPSTKSFQEICSRMIHGPGMQAVEAYDDAEEMDEIGFRWEGERKKVSIVDVTRMA